MNASKERGGESGGEDLAGLQRAYASILGEARAEIAAGREPALAALEKRLRAATRHEREREGGPGTALEQAESKALKQLGQIASIYRARALLAREPEPAPRPSQSLRSLLKIRPTITANMDVRRGTDGERLTLEWDSVPAVVEWEVRFSERRDPRGSYVELETLTLPAAEPTVEVPIAEHLFRVNILGRSRDGRLLRRALISSLARETWNDRWERRASAS